jgi:hypothetical protein
MLKRTLRPAFLGVTLLGLCGALAPPLPAQTPPPETYSITESNSMIVMGATLKIYRDGTRALTDRGDPPSPGHPDGYHSRGLIDFETHKIYLWDVIDTPLSCGVRTFSGDWAVDPFQTSAQETAELARHKPEVLGKETINGFSATVVRVTTPGQGATKAWIEETYGLVVKLEMIPENGTPLVLMEIKELSLAKPEASVFKLPVACENARVEGQTDIQGGKSHAVIEMIGTPDMRGPGACKKGFVWREAFEGDKVCVTPQIREQTAADNAAASGRIKPDGRCIQGFVWRDAGPNDHVCVPPSMRSQAKLDNQQSAYRVAPEP